MNLQRPRSVASPLHLILQFVEQPAEFRRVLLGARKSDWPIRCAAEVGVQEAMQFDGCTLEPGGFHFRPRVVSSELILRRLATRRKGLAKGIFRLLIGCLGYEFAPRAQKIRLPSSGGGKFRGDFSFRRSLSRTSTLAGQGTLPSPPTGCRIRSPESLLMLTQEYANCGGLSIH